MRGDHTANPRATAFAAGPPPHARGPPCTWCTRPRRTGTTPACAGTTGQRNCRTAQRRDHPRMRGDHQRRRQLMASRSGPPPHARGPPPRRRGRPARGGTTPACAGTTATATWGGASTPGTTPACAGTTPHRTRPHRQPADHPRMRGDHHITQQVTSNGLGPPPHARGPLRCGAGPPVGTGTTPACAGTTPIAFRSSVWHRDHPRMRGDHTTNDTYQVAGTGPPPHARGPHPRQEPVPQHPGTTPACAGTTQVPGMGSCSMWDHPRMRGDHFPSLPGLRPDPGPPPHARGPRLPPLPTASRNGTTPACAGTTWGPTGSPDGRRDHPRMRGDH